MDTIEKTLEYHELLMTLNNFENIPFYKLPEGYSFSFYKSNKDIDDWVDIHISTGEFASKEKSIEYFHSFYDDFIGELNKRCLFVVNDSGEKVATATLSPADEYGYNCVIDWFAIKKEYQGKHLSKPMLSAIVELAKSLGYKSILLHTQTHTWLAAKIYLDFGFEPFIFEDKKGWEILKTITNHEKLKDFKKLKDCELYDSLMLNVKKELDNNFKNYAYSVWYINNRNDVYVFDYETNKEYSYKFYDNGNVLKYNSKKNKTVK